MPSKLPRVERQLDLIYFTLGREYSQMVRRLSGVARVPSNTQSPTRLVMLLDFSALRLSYRSCWFCSEV